MVVALLVAAFLGVCFGRFVFAGRSASPPTAVRQAKAQSIEQLQNELRVRGESGPLLTDLGVAYLNQARTTADPTWYAKAGAALDRARVSSPDEPRTLTALGLLSLARHDFSGALSLGPRAQVLQVDSPDPLGVVVDANVELGRYEDAAAAAQEMVGRRPSLASLSRVSYLRELHGDTDGALAAMTQAAAAGSGSAADTAYVRTLIGDLHLGRGDLDAAAAAYARALSEDPGYGMAEYGQARVLAARGDLDGAARLLAPLVARLPFSAWAAFFGDVSAARGDTPEADRQYALVRTIESLNKANGVAVDLELARFEADHARDSGADAASAVALARSAFAARPTVHGSDTLGWALRQAGATGEALPHARDAVRLGTADAVLWYHLAAVEADLGMRADASAHLARAFAINPLITLRDLPAARSLALELGVSAP